MQWGNIGLKISLLNTESVNDSEETPLETWSIELGDKNFKSWNGAAGKA